MVAQTYCSHRGCRCRDRGPVRRWDQRVRRRRGRSRWRDANTDSYSDANSDPYPSSGYPDAANTGIPSGTTLTTPSPLDSDGNYVMNTANATLDGAQVPGCIIVRRTGITIKNSKARCIATEADADAPGATPRLKIQDSEVDCQRDPTTNTGPATGIFWGNMDVLRVDVQQCENAFDVETDTSIRDSYVHNLTQCKPSGPPECVEPDAHTDGIQSQTGDRLEIVHNTGSRS